MTVSELDFEVSYYSLGRFSETEMYKNTPSGLYGTETIPRLWKAIFI
jgi:hypothetical protein